MRRPHNFDQIEENLEKTNEAIQKNTEQLKNTNENINNLIRSNSKSSNTDFTLSLSIAFFSFTQIMLALYSKLSLSGLEEAFILISVLVLVTIAAIFLLKSYFSKNGVEIKTESPEAKS